MGGALRLIPHFPGYPLQPPTGKLARGSGIRWRETLQGKHVCYAEEGGKAICPEGRRPGYWTDEEAEVGFCGLREGGQASWRYRKEGLAPSDAGWRSLLGMLYLRMCVRY
jgi:hypothetical protein